MAFLRFSRDKRGYEHVYLVRPPGHRGKSAPRILYWFRTPPNVRVGREPFDESVRRALEAQHRDVAFNWPRLLATPMPPPDAERWRERRRAERAARRVVEAEVDVDLVNAANSPGLVTPVNPEPSVSLDGDGEPAAGDEARPPDRNEPSSAAVVVDPRTGRRRRRRRRRGRGGGSGVAPASTAAETNAPDRGRSEDGK
ncbi:MAG: hypothetical protein A3G76_14755 [Acidobacteria bacterium RIFCSPLOWO2_12_FULL_65_11]|nr:MAG: hypothetical protein A3H95_09060 [Acidobacteria bacterium RIFCSPLOWO2_02_FULL_64_15]OFW30977.1 MAG: hypothetical protein A3G76_14755 [Acidobacteria bacterium RIFCSPLOWO2_12_FULL_65_11]